MFISSVINTLNKKSISYALVGGYAVALHGAVRGAVDIDLIIALDLDTLKKMVEALSEIGLVPRLPLTAQGIYSNREDYIQNKNLIAWAFVNPDNPLEMVNVIITHDVRDFEIETKTLGTQALTLVSIQELIKLKIAAGRPQDLEDVRALEQLQ